MEKKNIHNYTKKVIMLILTVVFLSPLNLFADTYVYNIDDYDLCIWDVSGTYSEDMLGCSINYTLNQDAKGKITGGGCASCSIFEPTVGWIDIDMCYDFKGSVKQKNGVTTGKLSMKATGDAFAMGETLPFKAKEKITAQISCGDPTMYGTIEGKACVKKAGCESFSESYMETLSPDMTGAAILTIIVNQVDKNLLGTGDLELSNFRRIDFETKGKYDANSDESKISSKGVGSATGCKLKIEVDESNGQIISIKGKVLGQNIQYPTY